MSDKGLIAPYLASSLVNLSKPEKKSQFKSIKDCSSNKMNGFLINGSIPVILYSNMLTFRESNKSFILNGNLLKTMKIYEFNVDPSDPQDRKIIYEFGKEMKFDIEQKGRKSNRDELLIRLQKSPAIMAFGISTRSLPSDLNE